MLNKLNNPFENESAYEAEAPKQVKFTITPIGDKAALMVWRAQQQEKVARDKIARDKAYATRKNNAIEKWLELNKQMEAVSVEQQKEYDYRKTRLSHLNYVDEHKRKFGQMNNVICWKCKEIAIISSTLTEQFYFCKTCREEVFPNENS